MYVYRCRQNGTRTDSPRHGVRDLIGSFDRHTPETERTTPQPGCCLSRATRLFALGACGGLPWLHDCCMPAWIYRVSIGNLGTSQHSIGAPSCRKLPYQYGAPLQY